MGRRLLRALPLSHPHNHAVGSISSPLPDQPSPDFKQGRRQRAAPLSAPRSLRLLAAACLLVTTHFDGRVGDVEVQRVQRQVPLHRIHSFPLGDLGDGHRRGGHRHYLCVPPWVCALRARARALRPAGKTPCVSCACENRRVGQTISCAGMSTMSVGGSGRCRGGRCGHITQKPKAPPPGAGIPPSSSIHFDRGRRLPQRLLLPEPRKSAPALTRRPGAELVPV
jgi:hypothetical protein